MRNYTDVSEGQSVHGLEERRGLPTLADDKSELTSKLEQKFVFPLAMSSRKRSQSRK